MRHFRISVRLYALVGLALLIMAAVMMLELVDEHGKLVAQRKAMLEAMNENAITVFEAYYKQQQAGTLSQTDAQARAIEAISAMRYQGNGYFWINDMHPIDGDASDQAGVERFGPYRRTRIRTASILFVEFVNDGAGGRQGLRRLLLAEAGRRRAGPEIFACGGLRALGLGRRHRRLRR